MERAKIMSVEERTKMAKAVNNTFTDRDGLKGGMKDDTKMAGHEERRDIPKPDNRKDVKHPDTMEEPKGGGKGEHKEHEGKREEHEVKRRERKGGEMHIHHHHHYHGKE